MDYASLIETILQQGLRKYKFKNSNVYPIQKEETKGSVFAYRSKEKMTHSRGLVLTSEEAIHENKNQFTHWTPNVYRYGTYTDAKKMYTKGHEESNLRQINTFFVDFDIHTAKEKMDEQDIIDVAWELGLLPTMILKTDNGFQAYFVLENPAYVTAHSNFKVIKSAKMISQNLRKYFKKTLPVDMTCNHFGIARMPREDNIIFFDSNLRYSFLTWQDWSMRYTADHFETKPTFTVLSGTEGKRQIDEPWVDLLLHHTKFLGNKGLVGRNNTAFTLALAYFSSGLSQETCEYNLSAFNDRLENPMEEKELQKIIKSAYSERYQGASRDYILEICQKWVSKDLTKKDLFIRQGWYKFKKERGQRKRVHLSEWKQDLFAYLKQACSLETLYLSTTKKEMQEALKIPGSTLDKLIHHLKATNEIIYKKKAGRCGGIQIASTKHFLTALLQQQKDKQEAFMMTVHEILGISKTWIQNQLSQLKEKATIPEEITLFEVDTG